MSLEITNLVLAANDSMPPSGVGSSSLDGAPRIWTYATNDTLATVLGASYFDGAAGLLAEGDLIIALTEAGAADAAKLATLYISDISTADVVSVEEKFDDQFVLTAQQDDLSAADQVYLVAPFDCDIVAVYSVLNAALTTGDSTITVKAPDGTVGTITITQSGSAAGDVDSLTSGLSNTEVDAGQAIEIENDGTPGAGAASFTVICRRKTT